MNKEQLKKILEEKLKFLEKSFDAARNSIKQSAKDNVPLEYDTVCRLITNLELQTIEEIEALIDAKKEYDEVCLKDFKARNKVGMVTDKNYFTKFVGKGNCKSTDGRESYFTIEIGMVTGSPFIHFKNKYYVLTWDEIVHLAENAGLFDEETEEDNK